MNKRLNDAPCGYVSITSQGNITYLNQTFLDMVDCSRSDLLGKHIESVMNMSSKLLFHTYFYPAIQLDGYVNEVYLTLQSSKGQKIPVLLNGRRNERDETGTINCVFVKMTKRIKYEQEIRKAKREVEEAYRIKDEALAKQEQLHKEIEMKQKELITLNKELERLSVTDDLTGLKNRRFLLKKLDKNITLFTHSRSPFSLTIIDVDHFKKINDTWGHLVGDQVLRGVAKIMESIAGQDDIVARYGGEEFIIIMPNTDVSRSIQRAEGLRDIIEHTPMNKVAITVSVGVATFMPEDTNVSILNKADRALYASKQSGRNCVTHSEKLGE